MKMIFAPDSFKGSLSSKQIIEVLKVAAFKMYPECEIVGIPMADGGEGTIEAIISSRNGEYKYMKVKNTLGEDINSMYGIFDKDSVIIEMASASGLTLIPKEKRNPLYTTTYGTGQLIKNALDEGYRKIYIAIGGSGTNDGGIGAMSALGVKFLDKSGKEVKPIGESLIHIDDIDISNVHPMISKAEFTVICDVNNPLLGPNGATYVYGPQKGADEKILEQLEEGMKNYAKVIEKIFNVNIVDEPGAGAAGGLGAALLLFTSAKLKRGINTVLELINFEEHLNNVDLVVTGEGELDWQSTFGKVISGIGTLCKEKGIPAVAIVGGMGKEAQKIYQYGIESIMPTINCVMKLEDAMNKADELLLDAANRMFRMINIGIKMK